jgi:hypothetical protein
VHIDGWERRFQKNLLTAANEAVWTRRRETTAARYRNGEGGREVGEGECKVMLTDRLEIGNG